MRAVVMLDQLQDPRKSREPSRRPASSSSKRMPSADNSAAIAAPAPAPDDLLARKACTVDFRSGEAVHRHPDLKCYLDDGWYIESAVPKVSGAARVQLLVTLSRCEESPYLPVFDEDI